MNQNLQGRGLGIWTQGPKVGETLLTLLVFRLGSWASEWGLRCREVQGAWATGSRFSLDPYLAVTPTPSQPCPHASSPISQTRISRNRVQWKWLRMGVQRPFWKRRLCSQTSCVLQCYLQNRKLCPIFATHILCLRVCGGAGQPGRVAFQAEAGVALTAERGRTLSPLPTRTNKQTPLQK